jgi:hypothetical protein
MLIFPLLNHIGLGKKHNFHFYQKKITQIYTENIFTVTSLAPNNGGGASIRENTVHILSAVFN